MPETTGQTQSQEVPKTLSPLTSLSSSLSERRFSKADQSMVNLCS